MSESNNEYTPFSTTVVSGFLNEVRKNGDHYFADLSLITGKLEGDDKKNKLQFVSLLISKRLSSFSEELLSKDASLEKVYCKFTIHNLHFFVADWKDENGEKRVGVNNSGVLDKIELG